MYHTNDTPDTITDRLQHTQHDNVQNHQATDQQLQQMLAKQTAKPAEPVTLKKIGDIYCQISENMQPGRTSPNRSVTRCCTSCTTSHIQVSEQHSAWSRRDTSGPTCARKLSTGHASASTARLPRSHDTIKHQSCSYHLVPLSSTISTWTW